MAINFSVLVRNARLDAIETAIGAGAILKIRSGAKPATCADPDSGTTLATLNRPADYMANANAGQKAKSGTWDDAAADAAGTAGHFRLYAADGITCHAQGTVTNIGGGGDLEVDNTNFAAGQAFSVTAFTLREGHA